ncbi:MAG: O-antigen ligase family protein [Gemmatimonadales bacterium]|nr:O-antigen ligase family protein [Gemmatimonadales bacterium]
MTVFGRLYEEAGSVRSGLRRIGSIPIVVTFGSILLATRVVSDPVTTVLGAFVVLALIVAASLPRFVPRLFVPLLGLLLLGYAFFSRAFAHLGIPPVFVGELVLAVGLLSLLTNPQRWAAFRCHIAWLYLAFAAWGAARALPYLAQYGADTLRDSALWGYGVFALLVPATVLRPNWVPALLTQYFRWMPFLVLWIPVGLLLGHLFPHLLPQAQESGQSMNLVKPGDAGVHLAGAATFLLLGLHRAPEVRSRGGLLRKDWFLGTACVSAFVVIGVLGRGGALATLTAIFVVLVIRPLVAVPKVLLIGSVALFTAILLVASNVTIELGRRDLSAYQLGSNLLSIVGEVPDDQRNLHQTRDWRLRWWTHIVNYTAFGPYFWTGKGFGVNLAIDDGIKEETYNRSPHSGHMNVLARTGVPGAILWVLLQASFGASLLTAYVRAQRLGREWWARLELWILAYWLAFLTDISVAVYLEGPHGGIWFWSLMGLGIAVLVAERQLPLAPNPRPPQLGDRHEAAARP